MKHRDVAVLVGHTAFVELKAQATYGLVIAKVRAAVPYPRGKERDPSDNDMTLWIGALVEP